MTTSFSNHIFYIPLSFCQPLFAFVCSPLVLSATFPDVLLFSREATSTVTRIVLIGGFLLLAIAITLVVLRAERSSRLASVLLRLQDTSAQIRVRGAFLLLAVFVALAAHFGIETVLGAFI